MTRWDLLTEAARHSRAAQAARARAVDAVEEIAKLMALAARSEAEAINCERQEASLREAASRCADTGGAVAVWRHEPVGPGGAPCRVEAVRPARPGGEMMIHVVFPGSRTHVYSCRTGRCEYREGTLDVPATIAGWRAYCAARRTP